MRRLTKTLCVALSFIMLVNLTGIEVFASDIFEQKTEKMNTVDEIKENVTQDTVEKDEATDDMKESGNTEENLGGDVGETTDFMEENESSIEDVKESSEDTSVDAKMANDFKVELNGACTGIIITLLTEEIGNYRVVVKKTGDSELSTAIITKDITKDGPVIIESLNKGEKYNVSLFKVLSETEEVPIGEDIPVILLDTPSAVKATAGVSSAVLSWGEIVGATSYIITNVTTGETYPTTEKSYTFKNLKNGTKYSFNVKAIAEVEGQNGKEYRYESIESSVVSVTPQIAKPGQTTGLKAMDGDKSAILTWNKVSGASSYNIYRYNESKKKWDLIKTGVKNTTYTNTKLTPGMKYYYKVAAVNDGGIGALSTKVSVSIHKTPGTSVRTIGYKAIVRSYAPIFTSKTSKKRVKYLKKGTRITTIDYGNGRYKFKLADGKTYWIAKGRLTLTASIWTTKDYSTKVKTDFVNKKGYSSKTKYLIWINQYTQRVMIYYGKKGNWKLIRSCRCATGTHLFRTPKGVFKITYKEKGWFYKTTYEKPIVHFKGANSFHSRIHNYKGGYADATIGRPKSHGCVRMYDEDVTYIYKNCPIGTTVVSH